MKIVHVIDSLETGGAQQYVFDIVKGLKNNISHKKKKPLFNFYILAFEGGPFLDKFEKAGVKVSVLGISSFDIGIKNPQNIIKTINWLEKKYSNIKPNIIQTHLLGADIWARMAASKTKAKIIQTIHAAEDFRGNKKSRFGFKMLFFDKLLAKKTDVVIGTSKAIIKAYKRQKIKVKTTVIYPGIDLEMFKPNAKKRIKYKNQLNLKYLTFASIGRLEPVKGTDIFLKAISIANRKNPNIQYLIVGTGSLEKDLKKQAKQGKLTNVMFLGNRNDVSSLINAVDVIVMPSRSEGLGITLIEAAANKKAIIASRVGGILEVVDSNSAKLIQPDAKELANAIAELSHNQAKRAKFSEKAYKKSKKFNIRKIVEKYKKLYNGLIN